MRELLVTGPCKLSSTRPKPAPDPKGCRCFSILPFGLPALVLNEAACSSGL